MRKFYFIVFISFMFILRVNASSIDISLNCPSSVYTGDKISCSINSSTNGCALSGVKVNYEIVNGSYNSFTSGSMWNVYSSGSNGFAVGNTSGGIEGSSNIGTLVVTPSGNSVTIRLVGIDASDTDYNSYDISTKEAVVSIVERVVPPKEDNTPSDNNTNNNGNNNNNNNNTTNNTPVDDVYLDSLEIEGHSIEFRKDKFEYEIELLDNEKSINVKASSKYDVSGAKKYDIKDTKGTIEVVVSDNNQRRVYTIKYTKLSNIVKNNIEEVGGVLDKYDNIVINLKSGSDELIAYKRILDMFIGKNKTITYNIYDKDKLIYSFIFDGASMEYVLSDIDLGINFSSDKVAINDKNSIILDMKYKSYLSGTKLLIYNVKEKNNSKLYRVNSENNLELVSSIVFKDNTATLDIDKGNLYVLTNISTNSSNNYETVSVIQTFLIIIVLLEFAFVSYKYISLRRSVDKKNKGI